MITILPVRQKVQNKISKFGLVRKFEKQIKLLTVNPKHPSLNLELLEPKRHGIYSFRIDRKYRALFLFLKNVTVIEVIAVTSHYK